MSSLRNVTGVRANNIHVYHLGIYNYIDTKYRATILVSKPPEWKKVSQKVSLMQPMLSM